MSYFLKNGEDSRNYGILENCPVRPLAAQKHTSYNVPGRTEDLIISQKTREDVTLKAVIGLKDRTQQSALYTWLSNGGNVVFSDDLTKINRVKRFELSPKYISERFAKYEITFVCSPYLYATEPTNYNLTSATSYTVINNTGSEFSEPIITLKPSGTEAVTISINGEDFVVEIPEAVSTNGYAITIDSEIMIAYYTDTDGNKISCTEYTTGHFPLLHVGENYIKHSGGVSEMSINMNERWY